MNPEKLFSDVAEFVQESRDLLKKGAVMELAGLDSRVALLCKEVLELSQQDRVKYAGRLQKLFDDLTALGNEMIAQRDTMSDKLQHMSQHKKGLKAYKVVDASDKKEE